MSYLRRGKRGERQGNVIDTRIIRQNNVITEIISSLIIYINCGLTFLFGTARRADGNQRHKCGEIERTGRGGKILVSTCISCYEKKLQKYGSEVYIEIILLMECNLQRNNDSLWKLSECGSIERVSICRTLIES